MRTRRATSCMCERSRSSSSGVWPGERGVEVAIGEEVDEDLARDALDLLLRHPERLRHAVPLLEQRR